MRKRPISVEWHIAESDADWDALRAERDIDPVTTGRSPRHQWLGTLLIILIAGVGIWYWQSGQSTPIDSDGAVAIEDRQALLGSVAVISSTNTTSSTAPRTLTPLPDRGGLFNGDVARMLEHPEQAIHTYQTLDGPLRAILAGGLWGAQQELETASFHLYFRQLDAKTIARAAPQLDQLYQTMRQNFGLSTTPAAAKIVIQVTESYTQATAPYRPRTFDQITVFSPALYSPVVPWTAADLFTQSVVLALVDQLLAEAVDQYSIGAARDPLLAGLRLWQLWDLPLPLADYDQTLVQWIYDDLPTIQQGDPLPLPADYTLLCETYTLWMDHPAQLRIPLLCTDQDAAAWRLPARVLQLPPTQLPWLNAPIYLDEQADGHGRVLPITHPGEAIALATLVDYVVVSYGRARLPLFVANINRFDTWDELIPAVFELPSTAFEADWQRFVAQSRKSGILTGQGRPNHLLTVASLSK